MKFRKKPVVIEALQYNGRNLLDVVNFIKSQGVTVNLAGLIIHTLEGDMTASVGDWIIQGVKGEFYPCKPDIFDMTYEGFYAPGEYEQELTGWVDYAEN